MTSKTFIRCFSYKTENKEKKNEKQKTTHKKNPLQYSMQ